MSKLLNSVTGGGGAFVPYTEVTAGTIAAASSGTLLDVTPSAGNKIRIKRLSTNSAGGEANITVEITTNDGVKQILNNGTLDDNQPNVDFVVGNYDFGNLTQSDKAFEFIDCAGFKVIKTTGSTTQAIGYSYVEGRFE